MRKIGEKRGKKAVMDLPFSVIFGIILIIAFIVVAFYVVSHFLCLGDETKSGMFFQDFQQDVNEAWNAPDLNVSDSYILPGKVDYVCFLGIGEKKGGNKAIYDEELYRYEDEGNVFLYPRNKCYLSYKEIAHIDIGKITEEDNPYCIKANGNIKINLKKGFYDSLVDIN